VGALYVRQGTGLVPAQTGGSQEHGLRAGTHNVPLIVGMAEALRLTDLERETQAEHFRMLRDRLIAGVLEGIPGARLTGHRTERLPNHASFVFRGLDGNALVAALDMAGYGCSSGSACKTGSPELSEALTAIGLPREWALGSLRVTVGRRTTITDIDGLLEGLPGIVGRLRKAEAPAS
jgi:cysteine desulfurase